MTEQDMEYEMETEKLSEKISVVKDEVEVKKEIPTLEKVEGTDLKEVKKEEIKPNHTIYIQNINEKIKLPELKKQLYALFTKFGPVIDIEAKNNKKLRGQAFVVFKDLTAAALAMKQMDGYDFLGKPIRISFAKSKSDAIAKLDGTFIDQKKKREEEQNQKKKRPRDEKKDEKKKKKVKQVIGPSPIIPSNILFVENIPDISIEDIQKTLNLLFSNYPGFKEVRLVSGKKSIAFVEYENELQSSNAMNNLNEFNMYGSKLKVTFSKK